MGRIKTKQVKRITNKLMEKHEDELTSSFDENKEVVEKHTTVNSKKLRNRIAGHATRLKSNKEDDQE